MLGKALVVQRTSKSLGSVASVAYPHQFGLYYCYTYIFFKYVSRDRSLAWVVYPHKLGTWFHTGNYRPEVL